MKKTKAAKKKAPKKSRSRRTAVRKATDQNDIVELMLRDHKPLKKLIKVMKDPENEMSELREAFEEFAPLLEAHAKPEQDALYTFMEKEGEEEEVRIEGFEGHAEHAIADQLAKEIPGVTDEDEWKAKVKVLAELVEHHIEEEEEEMIPELRKDVELEQRVEIGQEYLHLREAFPAAESEAA